MPDTERFWSGWQSLAFGDDAYLAAIADRHTLWIKTTNNVDAPPYPCSRCLSFALLAIEQREVSLGEAISQAR